MNSVRNPIHNSNNTQPISNSTQHDDDDDKNEVVLQQRDVLARREAPSHKLSTTTPSRLTKHQGSIKAGKRDTTTTPPVTASKLQQLKSSVREQRFRHATILCGGGKQTTPSATRKSTGTGSSTRSVDGTNSSQCSYYGSTTVTTTQSTMVSSSSSNSSSSQQTVSLVANAKANANCSRRLHRTIAMVDGTISPLSCGPPHTPTQQQRDRTMKEQRQHQQYVHLHRSIHVPNLSNQSLEVSPGMTSSFEDDNTSNTSDDDDDQPSTTSSTSSSAVMIQPPTLEDIYAAMGEPRATTTEPSTMTAEAMETTSSSPPRTVTSPAANTITNDPIQPQGETTIATVSLVTTNVARIGGTHSNSNATIESGRSSYIAQMYEPTCRLSSPLSCRRPTTGLRRFEQRLQQQQKESYNTNSSTSCSSDSDTALEQPQEQGETIPKMSFVRTEGGEQIKNGMQSNSNNSSSIMIIPQKSKSTDESTSEGCGDSILKRDDDTTSLSDDVLDTNSATIPLSIDNNSNTSLATESFSEFNFDRDLDDDNDDDDDVDCDYTTNSDTSGWASMGDSTAGPLGYCDSITDQMSVGSLCSSIRVSYTTAATKPTTIPPVSMIKDETVQRAHLSLPSKPTTPIKSILNGGKVKNTVTFQMETVVSKKSNGHERALDKVRQKVQQQRAATTKPLSTKDGRTGTACADIKPLFVSARRADELCRTSGGHYSIALQCGMTLLVSDNNEDERRIPLVALPIAPTSPTFVRLSTDFRCGTYGSLYDIAARSGGTAATSTDVVKELRKIRHSSLLTDNSSIRRNSSSKVRVREPGTRKRIIRSTTTTTTTRKPQQRTSITTLPPAPPRPMKTTTIAHQSSTSQSGCVYDATFPSGVIIKRNGGNHGHPNPYQ